MPRHSRIFRIASGGWIAQSQSALRQLRRAIEKNYCVYPALDTDPLLENIRNTPEFQVIRKTAVTCYEKFGATHGLQ